MVGLWAKVWKTIRMSGGPKGRAAPRRSAPAASLSGGENDAAVAAVIADLAQKRYADEHARSKDIEAKASPVLSLMGAALIFGAGALSSGGTCLTGWERWCFYGFLILGLLLLLLAELNLLLVLSVQGFQYFHLRDWASEEIMQRPRIELRRTYEEIAGSYGLYTEQNVLINNKKAGRYRRALVLLFFGVAILVGDFMWAGCGLPRLW